MWLGASSRVDGRASAQTNGHMWRFTDRVDVCTMSGREAGGEAGEKSLKQVANELDQAL